MAADDKHTHATELGLNHGSSEDDPHQVTDTESTIDAQKYSYTEDRKIGITGSVFLILNKMIGTGSKLNPSATSA